MGALNQQPVVRTTRAQELRQRAIAKEQPIVKKVKEEQPKQVAQVKNHFDLSVNRNLKSA